ncbi:hypothetical protein [Nocardia sp. CA-290969]|uniref:hypothetical protein n=1 Tax=Nocardia sp. CA-290969 TaxID=3239986 RepID=UPI003D8C8D17
MSGELRLDLAGLRERGAQLAEIADRVKQTHTELRDSLSQAEGSWGDDHMGRAFAEQFTPHADRVLATVQAMAEHLRNTAARTVQGADEFTAQDAQAAARVAGAARDLDPGSNELTEPRPTGAAGPVSPVDAGRPGASDRVVSSPEQSSPVYPTAGEQYSGQQPADGRQRPSGTPSPEATPGRAVPGDDRQQQAPWSRSRPESGPASNGAADAPGPRSPSSAPPPSAAVSPPPVSPRPVAPPPVSSTPERSSAPRPPEMPPGNRATTPAARRDTPWSEQPGRTAGPPRMPGTAGNPGTPENPAASPRPGVPPRPNAPAGEKPREPDRRDRREQPGPDPAVEQLAREVAERHGVQVTGFDTPGLRLPPVQEFVTALDRVLTGYPMITLDIVAVAELADDGPVGWSCETRGVQGDTRSITLDRRAAQQVAAPTRAAETDGTASADIYPATLRAFGRALDAAGGGVARRQVQRVLIAEYLDTQPRPRPALAEVVRGYREWRAELAGSPRIAGDFDLDEALGVAFAAVVQNGAEAGIQARLIHAVLVAAATRPE